MASSTTIVNGVIEDALSNPLAGEYVYFRLKQAGADNTVVPTTAYASGFVQGLTNASGELKASDGISDLVLWVNGESSIKSIYEITTKSGSIEPTQVIIPVSATGGSIAIGELMINYGVDSSPQQDSTLTQSQAYTNALAADPSSNGSFSAENWRTDLNVEDGATADQTDAEIKSAYENNSNTNAYTDSEKSKLSGIESGANANLTDSEIKTAYESNSNTNAFTDTEKTKLSSIESGATADQTDSEIKAAYENNSDTNAFTDADKSRLDGIIEPNGGGQVGSHAASEAGGAVGFIATTDAGGAVGSYAQSTTGGAVGSYASSEAGGSIGASAQSTTGGAVGSNAKSTTGGAVGESAETEGGGAVGYKATASDGGAVGSEASATTGGAVGISASTSVGGSVGAGAASEAGGAIGLIASTTSGGAVGYNADSTIGGAIGSGASTTTGGAVGHSASSTTGFAGGNGATASADGGIAIGSEANAFNAGTTQIGSGINSTLNTIQFRGSGPVNADQFGRLATSTTGIGTLGDTVVGFDITGPTDTSAGTWIENGELDGKKKWLNPITSATLYWNGATSVWNVLNSDGSPLWRNYDDTTYPWEVTSAWEQRLFGTGSQPAFSNYAFDVTATDHVVLVDDDTAGESVKLNLPSAATVSDGWVVTIKKEGSTGHVTIAPSGSDTIDGKANMVLQHTNQATSIVSNGTNWCRLYPTTPNGWAYYKDAAYDTSTRFTLPNGTRTQLTIDGLFSTTNKDYLPDGVTDFWDTTNNKIMAERLGDSFDIRIAFEVYVPAVTESITVQLDIGSGSEVNIVEQTVQFAEAGDQFATFSFPIFTLATFLANGGKIYLTSNYTGGGTPFEIWGASLFIKRDFSPL